MHRTYSFLLSLLLFSSMRLFAAESRPVVEKLPSLKCQDWKTEFGLEGSCIYKTVDGEWELGFTKIGKEKRTLKYKVKNLVVLFHPSGNSHKVQEWWGGILGKDKALDPDKNVFLSIGVVGDHSPKVGAPQKLNIDVILDAALAVITNMYPDTDFLVGGASMGGGVAYLLSQKSHGMVKGVFMISSLGFSTPNEKKIFQGNLDAISMIELSSGPYSEWSEKQKIDFWQERVRSFIDYYYTDQFFHSPASMAELGKPESEYKDAKSFKSEIIDSWVDWSVKTSDLTWFEAQSRALIDGIKKSEETFTKTKLPKKFLLVYPKEDKLFELSNYEKFVTALKQKKRDVVHVVLDDPRGHMACCSSTYDPKFTQALSSFLSN